MRQGTLAAKQWQGYDAFLAQRLDGANREDVVVHEADIFAPGFRNYEENLKKRPEFFRSHS